MTDAPEKIWATAEGLIAGPWRTPGEGDPLVETPYTRDDVKEAEKRAEYLRGLEDAAAFCESHAAAIPYGEHRHTAPTYAGYVMDEIDHEAEFNHQGNGYAAAIRALAKEVGE